MNTQSTNIFSTMTDMNARTQSLIDEFIRRFNKRPTHLSRSPGRVNLIGEHTDYNDGFVLPVAIKRYVQFVLCPRTDRRVRIHSLEYESYVEFDMDDLKQNKDLLWSNYIQGVIWSLESLGLPLVGMDAVLSGNVPRGSGLSSSAALEVSAASAFLAAASLSDALTGSEIARAAQRAENDFVGVNCGIMDQFISALGEEGAALLIDCRSLTYQLVPFPEEAAIVIGNTKASRTLAGSAYNRRRKECEEGMAILQRVLPDIQALRDVSPEALDMHKALLSPTIHRRCHHVVHENERVMATIEALKSNDLRKVGRLMDESHRSLRDDYEVSSDSLDVMVETMRAVPGCYGARMTGAGFGGCAVALVEPGREQAVADAIFERYPKVTNIWPEVYTTKPGDGAQIVALDS